MGYGYYKPNSIEEYKGLKLKQIFTIDNKEYTIYRLDDKRNEVTLLGKNSGFKYADVDEFLKLVKS
jgi:hypothetical protein